MIIYTSTGETANLKMFYIWEKSLLLNSVSGSEVNTTFIINNI